MRARLAGVSKSFGAQHVLDAVTLAVGPRDRVGVVGPNGSGKSTLLRLLAGVEEPDEGTVERTLEVGYLPQEADAAAGETLLAYLARRTGVAAAERELERAAPRAADEPEAYDRALSRFLALGGGDLESRARAVCAELGLGAGLEREAASLSGGEAARLRLAAIQLARFDVLCLDEPTNDLDFDGLDRLEAYLAGFRGAVVVVSHDRAFLDRTVRRIVEVDEWTHGIREWPGGWSDFEAARDAALARQRDRHEAAEERRREVRALLAERRQDARAHGKGAGRRGTHALMSKVRAAERALERVERVEKPYEPWRLQLSLAPAGRAGDRVLALEGAVVEVGGFRLGPVDVEVRRGDRLAVTGPNGSGKTTLLRALLGELPLAAGRLRLGPGTVVGAVEQEREGFSLAGFEERTGLPREEARTLLAKFGLGAEHLARGTLSPGERTRARLAELMARGVNCLVLDEPTNHLDLEAIEELEGALAGFPGAVVVVSHDRRFLERVAPTATLSL